MKFFYNLALILLLAGCGSESLNSTGSKGKTKILFICTSEAEFNGHQNGTYLQEIAIPIYEFHQNGIEVDILSPAGGAIPTYHKFDTTEALHRAIQSDYFLDRISKSKRPQKTQISDYSAIVIPGGYGQFKDLHQNKQIKKMIVAHYEKQRIIGTVGHGTALLAQLKLNDGSYLVNEVTMTCFPNWNETNIMEESEKGKLLPFLMEDELRKNGADLKIYDHEKKINYEIIDEDKRIVTAAFADGGEFVATKIMELIKSN